MATTGYYTREGGKTHVCKGCADDADLPTGKFSSVETTMFAHGDGGGPCVVCGLDTMDLLARKVLRGRTDKELATPDDLDVDEVEGVAALIDAARPDALVCIDLAPGVEPERTEVGPGVTVVEHPDEAAETLYVDFDPDHDHRLEHKVEWTEAALDAWGWRFETHRFDDEDAPAVRIRAVPDEA